MPFTLAPQHFDVIYDKFSFLSQKKTWNGVNERKWMKKITNVKNFTFATFDVFESIGVCPLAERMIFFFEIAASRTSNSQAAVSLVGSIAVINNNRKMTCQIRSVRIILWIMNGTLLLPLLCSAVLCLCKCLALGSVQASVFDCECGCAKRVKLSPPLCCLLR